MAGRGGGLLADLGKERIADFADPRATCDSVTAPNTLVLGVSGHTLTKMNAAHVLDAPLSLFSKKKKKGKEQALLLMVEPQPSV